MTPDHIDTIAAELNIGVPQMAATAALLADGATVPFIARYRKEVTGNADDATIAKIADRIAFHREFEDRRWDIPAGSASYRKCKIEFTRR